MPQVKSTTKIHSATAYFTFVSRDITQIDSQQDRINGLRQELDDKSGLATLGWVLFFRVLLILIGIIGG